VLELATGKGRLVPRLALVAVALAAGAGGAAVAATDRARKAEERACPQRQVTAAYSSRVHRALRAKRDVWGETLLATPGGPTYEGAPVPQAAVVGPGPAKRALTDSGVYYVAFAQPRGVEGAGSVALHVADGSQIISDHVGGRHLTVRVGRLGHERYGSCLARPAPARLAGGYMPILEARYVDASGARYRQESFAARIP
jgi:hypothetical protein